MIDSKTVLERLASMAKLYERCLNLTYEILQKNSLDDEKTAHVLFDRRNKILEKIKKLEQGLKIQRQKGQNLLVGVAPGDEKKTEALLRELRNLITKLMDADKKLKKQLQKEIHRTGEELKRIKQGHLLLKKYTPYRKGISYYVSRRG